MCNIHMQTHPACAWPRAGPQAGARSAASGKAAGGTAPAAAGRGAKRPSSAPESPTHAARAKALMLGGRVRAAPALSAGKSKENVAMPLELR